MCADIPNVQILVQISDVRLCIFMSYLVMIVIHEKIGGGVLLGNSYFCDQYNNIIVPDQ